MLVTCCHVLYYCTAQCKPPFFLFPFSPPTLQTYAETAEVFSEVHVEQLLLFALIWSYGGVLLADRCRFSQLLKTLTNSMPDDSEYCVFDYYVDESGEWDVWQTR